MKIAYCTNVRLPSERAHGHQVAEVCRAIAELGHQVTIFCPYRINPLPESFHSYHRLNATIVLQYVGNYDYVHSSWFPAIFGLQAMNLKLGRALGKILHKQSFDLVYTRTPSLLPHLLKTDIPVLLELHQLPRFRSPFFVHNLRRCLRVVCLTSLQKKALIAWGIPEEKIVVEPDGVRLEEFTHVPDATLTRTRYGMSAGVSVVGYAGQLRSMGLSKGVEILLNAIQLLHQDHQHIHCLIAGGPPEAESALQRQFHQPSFVTFLGQRPHAEIPAILSACDVLVYPAPASQKSFYQRDTSPLKIFEYMATGVPMVVADLPPLHDVINAETALFIKPGDASALAAGIRQIITDKQTASTRAHRAREAVRQYSWQGRMKRIIQATKVVQ